MPIVQVLKNFLGSEKGILALALIIGVTVLTALGKMTIAEWQEYTIWIFGIYTGGKAVQGAASAISNGRKPDELKPESESKPALADSKDEEVNDKTNDKANNKDDG